MDERHLDDVHLWVQQHFYNACELVYIAEGEYLIHLGNDDKLVKEGEIIYIYVLEHLLPRIHFIRDKVRKINLCQKLQ